MELTDKVKMSVIEFELDHISRGRRGTPKLEVGTKLYAIRYAIGGYFTYSYLHRDAAEKSIRNMKGYGTDTFQYYGFNKVNDVQQTMPCIKTVEELN